MADRIKLFFGTGATLGLSYSVVYTVQEFRYLQQ